MFFCFLCFLCFPLVLLLLSQHRVCVGEFRRDKLSVQEEGVNIQALWNSSLETLAVLSKSPGRFLPPRRWSPGVSPPRLALCLTAVRTLGRLQATGAPRLGVNTPQPSDCHWAVESAQ